MASRSPSAGPRPGKAERVCPHPAQAERTSILRFTRNGLKEIAGDVIFMANKEGLTGHAASVELRANDNGPAARPKPKPEKVAAAAASAAAPKK